MSELTLTPTERYFFYDHRESHPAWIRYDFTFRGALEHAALARALAQQFCLIMLKPKASGLTS